MTRGRNPLLPAEYHFADGEARTMPDGRLYLYCSEDVEPGTYCSAAYRVVSTEDLCEWTVHDVAFEVSQAGWAGETIEGFLYDATVGSRNAVLYAPDAIERDGKYYLYFCLSDESEGVAVAESPWGPFTDARRLPVTGIDPAVLVDDDGQAYYFWGQQSAHGARLAAGMMSIDETSVRSDVLTVAEHAFHEGSSSRRRGDVYYLVFADESRGRPTCLGYATSDAPLGPYTYRGVIIDNAGCDPETWNNHGSIARMGDQWYVFYHRSSQGDRGMRRMCAEPISFTPDGLIPEVVMTSQGPGEPFRRGESIPGGAACGLTGTARIGPVGGAGEAISAVSPGDTAAFRYIALDDEPTAIGVTGSGRCTIDVLLSGERVVSVDIGGTPAVLPARPGVHELILRFVDPDDCAVTGVQLRSAPRSDEET